MANVALVPGFMGSQLVTAGSWEGDPAYDVWINYDTLAEGAIGLLDLAADGVSPGPLAPKGAPALKATRPLDAYYGPLYRALLKAGHTVHSYGWDWRRSIETAANDLADWIIARFGTDPIYIVAHSAGGLVARLGRARLIEHDHPSQIKAIFFCGTPHYGTYVPINCAAGRDPLYKSLVELRSWVSGYTYAAEEHVMDALMSRWVGLWQLLPDPVSGPYSGEDVSPLDRFYKAAWYGSIRFPIQQSMLDAAAAFWRVMDPIKWRDEDVFFAGDGPLTPSACIDIGPPPQFGKMVETPQGDGTVHRVSSLPAKGIAFTTNSRWDHVPMVQTADCVDLVLEYLGNRAG